MIKNNKYKNTKKKSKIVKKNRCWINSDFFFLNLAITVAYYQYLASDYRYPSL